MDMAARQVNKDKAKVAFFLRTPPLRTKTSGERRKENRQRASAGKLSLPQFGYNDATKSLQTAEGILKKRIAISTPLSR